MTEGNYPKSDGDILYASEFNTSLFNAYKSEIRQDLNFKKNSSTTINTFPNVFVDDFTDTTYVSSTTGSPTLQTGDYVFDATGTLTSNIFKYFDGTIAGAYLLADISIYDTYDEFDDASINTALWTTSTTSSGTVTESGGKLTIADANGSSIGTATAETKGTGSNNLDGFSEIRFFADTSITKNGGSVSINISATDSSTDVALKTYSSSSGLGSTKDVLIKWDATNQIATVFIDGLYDGTIDCTSLTPGIFRLKFHVSTSTDGTNLATLALYHLRTISSSPASTITAELAADGSTLETSTINGYHVFTATGSELQAKYTVTISGTEFVYINGYGVKVEE